MKSLGKIENSSASKAVANNTISGLTNAAQIKIIQSKLTVGEPEDEYEKEADVVADKVMRMPELFINQKGIEEKEPIQKKLIAPVQLKFEDSSNRLSKKENSNTHMNVTPWSPIKVTRNNQKNLIQRRINYLAQVTGQAAAPFLTAFDNTVTQVERSLVGVTGNMAGDVRAAMTRVRALRAAGRVTCWQISGGLVYASYDNATGQLRLHTNWGVGRPTSRRTVVHEAIHALHGNQHPRLSRMYAQVLAAGGTTNAGLATVLLQFKAWTEYWAYRRAQEHYNQIHPQHASNAHQSALGERDVRRSIARVAQVTGSPFTPWTWTPPARIPGVRRRRP